MRSYTGTQRDEEEGKRPQALAHPEPLPEVRRGLTMPMNSISVRRSC